MTRRTSHLHGFGEQQLRNFQRGGIRDPLGRQPPQ